MRRQGGVERGACRGVKLLEQLNQCGQAAACGAAYDRRWQQRRCKHFRAGREARRVSLSGRAGQQQVGEEVVTEEQIEALGIRDRGWEPE